MKTEIASGTTLLDAARQVGVYVSSICGGDGYCGKCKVSINDGQFQSKPTTLLTPEEVRDNIVLACQTRILSDMSVTISKSHTLETSQIVTEADTERFSMLSGETLEDGFALKPLIRKIFLQMDRPTVENYTADHERLNVAVRNHLDIRTPVLQMGYRVLQELPYTLRDSDYKVTATVACRGGAAEIVQLERGDTSGTNYAVAVDLGTTTVVTHLVDATTGKTLNTEATYNSQISFGEDYIRRIIYAEQNEAFDELQNKVLQDINGLIVTLAEKQSISLQDITAVICAGNTAMMHFLLNIDSRHIRREPYVATAAFIPPIRAAEVGIQINKRGLLYCLPSVAAYVGGDIVAGVLATGLNRREDLSLLVDIGTNGEVVLGNKEWMMCASSSAGPAFEGSGVKNGMRAGKGAIEKLQFDSEGKVEYQTVGDAHPIGICGSGLLDVIAELFSNGIIDRTGRFTNIDDPRITEDDEGKQFTLAPAVDSHSEVVITQADINNLIRSKAGVFAAIKVLMDTTQTKTEDLDAIFLAGGFGNYLNVDQAVKIGMLPDVPTEKIHFVGNTSIAGAKAVLVSRYAQITAEQIAHGMTYADLMSHSSYMDEFIKAKFIPHTNLALFPSQKNNVSQT